MGTQTIDGYDDIHHNLRFWIRALLDQIEPKVPDMPRIVYDIGANDGELTLPLAGDGTRVIAFEPQPAARSRLMSRAAQAGLEIALWGVADLTVVPLALGDRDTMIPFQVYSDDTFSSQYARPAEEQERYQLQAVHELEVRMRPLDDLVTGGVVPPPDLVKIDVEGAERAVLTGAMDTLTRHHPPVIAEFSCPNTANAGYPRREIVDLLTRAGYLFIGGLFRHRDTVLYGPESFDDCRIWNVVAVADRPQAEATSAMGGLIARHYSTTLREDPHE